MFFFLPSLSGEYSNMHAFIVSLFFFWAVAEWAKDALQGLKKGAPFSLCLTNKHFSRVSSAQGNSKNELSKVVTLLFNALSALFTGVKRKALFAYTDIDLRVQL